MTRFPVRAGRKMRVAHDEPGRERAHDGREANAVGQPAHQEGEGQREKEPRLGRLEPAEGIREAPCDAVAQEDHGRHERRGQEGDSRGLTQVDPARGDDSRHHGQDDQAEHVVDHGGAQDEPGLVGLEPSQVLEHARGDADARGRQRRADEEMHRGRRLR